MEGELVPQKKGDRVGECESERVGKTEQEEEEEEEERELERLHKTMSVLIFQLNLICVQCCECVRALWMLRCVAVRHYNWTQKTITALHTVLLLC